MATTVLGNVLEFFQELGIYDIILPFLLTFTIIFAIFERTKIFGMEKVGDKEFTKKNLNAMVAFAIAFMTVASSQIVGAILQVSSQMVVLLLLGVFFLLLIGTFYKEGKIWEKPEEGGMPNWTKNAFVVIFFIAILAIFLGAVKRDNGQSWLEYLLQYIANYWSSTAVASIILILLIILFIWYLTGKEKEEEGEEKKGAK